MLFRSVQDWLAPQLQPLGAFLQHARCLRSSNRALEMLQCDNSKMEYITTVFDCIRCYYVRVRISRRSPAPLGIRHPAGSNCRYDECCIPPGPPACNCCLSHSFGSRYINLPRLRGDRDQSARGDPKLPGVRAGLYPIALRRCRAGSAPDPFRPKPCRRPRCDPAAPGPSTGHPLRCPGGRW